MAVALLGLPVLAACTPEPARSYPLRGQIIAVGDREGAGARRQVTVKHDDIPNFMPAMTMPYYVNDPAALDAFTPGDLFTATLAIKGSAIELRDLKKTGHADPPSGARAVKIMDVMQTGDEVPDDALVDQAGTTRQLSDWRGRALAVTFVYTRCPLPDFCPLVDRRFGELQRAIAADPALRERAHLISVTFDPAHDAPPVIAAHAAMRGADPRTWSYLTGPSAAIEHFTSRFGVSVMPAADAADTVVHNLRTAIVDRRGRLVTIHSGSEWTVDAVLADLRKAGGV